VLVIVIVLQQDKQYSALLLLMLPIDHAQTRPHGIYEGEGKAKYQEEENPCCEIWMRSL